MALLPNVFVALRAAMVVALMAALTVGCSHQRGGTTTGVMAIGGGALFTSGAVVKVASDEDDAAKALAITGLVVGLAGVIGYTFVAVISHD